MKHANKKTPRMQKLARIVTFAAAIIGVVCMLAAAIVESAAYAKYTAYANQKNDDMNAILRYLEYNGLDSNAQEMMKAYSGKYTDYSNFILINGKFQVQYSLNKGYLDSSGQFFGLLHQEEYSQYGIVCDKEGTILSMHYLAGESYEAFRRLSQTCSVKPKGLQTGGEGTGTGAGAFSDGIVMEGGAASVTIINNYSNYSVMDYGLKTEMYFAPMAAKDLYLYFISPMETNSLWGQRASLDRLRNVSLALALISIMLYWMALPVWVFIDASKRNSHPALWGILALFTNVVGLIVYLVVRPEGLTCKACKEPLNQNYSYCPLCGMLNQAHCPQCNVLVRESWSHCPYCGAALQPPAGSAQEAQTEENSRMPEAT